LGVVVGDSGVDGGVGRRGGHRGHAQRITVRRGLGRFIGANHAAATRLVFNHHDLAHGFAQGICHGAGNDVGRTTGRKRHLEFDDFVGVALCIRLAGQRKKTKGEK
jgi:hypothetical protein